jgi:hypothetical protein
MIFNFKFIDDVEIEMCGRYPKEQHILTDNGIWQIAETSHGFIYLLSAFLDTRWNESVVRILVNAPKDRNGTQLFCQFWFDDDKSIPLVVEASEVQATFNLGESSFCQAFCFL